MNLTVNTTAGDVNAFDASALNVTGAMSAAMKTYYDTELLENARPRLIFTQLGKSQFLPAGHGDSVQWRKWNTFEKSLTPLTEGVIPSGQKLGQSAISVSVQQYVEESGRRITLLTNSSAVSSCLILEAL